MNKITCTKEEISALKEYLDLKNAVRINQSNGPNGNKLPSIYLISISREYKKNYEIGPLLSNKKIIFLCNNRFVRQNKQKPKEKHKINEDS